LDVRLLDQIASGLACAENLWRPHVVHDAEQRARVRLLATDAYEVWLLGWTPGQSVGLHDHGDANGAFVVVDGELTETHLSRRGLVDTTLRVGRSGRIPAGQVHDVANRSPRNATSIHAYSPPLEAMGFYATDGALDRVEAVHEQDAIVDPSALSAVLHPTRRHRRG
jgi:mannose-6-phosphate isomerase-like protein (cupin superfamily)